jgi:hypothetical protein
MSAGETARYAYESSRQEILERIRLRDNALLGYLGAAGVVFGVAVGNSSKVPILLLMPYLALAAALVVGQHDWTIGAICGFLTEELRPFLENIGEGSPTWESCAFLREYSYTAIGLRTLSHMILIALPAALSLAWLWPTVNLAGTLLERVWWFSAAVAVMVFAILTYTHTTRRHHYTNTTWN